MAPSSPSAQPISADSHAVEGPEVFDGLADRFGDEAPRIVHPEGKAEHIVIPARKGPGVNVGIMALAATRLDREGPLERKPGHKPGTGTVEDPEIRAYLDGGYAAMRPGLVDGARRGEDQDVDGIAAEFLYPGFFPMFGLKNVELLVALQQNYNDWLHRFCAASKGRLHGIAALPVQDPEAATKELERVIGLGYRGVILPSNAPKGRRYCDEEYDPLWSRAQEARVPISFHVGCFSHIPAWLRESSGRDPITIYAGTSSLIHDTLVELMCRGVCKRFPELQFVVAEFNAGWIAHWLERADQGWQREFAKDPSGPAVEPVAEIWKRQFHATIEDDQPALRTRDLIGEDRLMWGSDYPHTDSTWPCSADVLDEMFTDCPASTRAAITRDNVARLYRL
ncbi:MAG: amidohydrolase family protein [Myxococcota bacterium]|nr:amidohydrolase family protein [Myxococcota bacterium]